jgi:hypothetical protein
MFVFSTQIRVSLISQNGGVTVGVAILIVIFLLKPKNPFFSFQTIRLDWFKLCLFWFSCYVLNILNNVTTSAVKARCLFCSRKGNHLRENEIYPSGQKKFTNRFVENFLQPTYKIDICPLACEKHMLFK